MPFPFGMARMRNIFSQPETQDEQQKRFLGGVTPFGPKRADPYQTLFTGEAPSVDAPSMPALNDEEDETSKYMRDIAQLQTKKGPALTAYQEALKSQPTYDDYKPGIGRRIGAIAAAAMSGYGGGVGAGMDAGQQVLDSKYNTATGEYQRKIRGLKDSATLEEASNRSQINALAQARALGLKYDQYKLKQTEVAGKQRTADANSATNQQRADAYIKARGRKGYKYTAQEDGSLLATNTADPSDVFTVPAKTVASGQLRVNRRNADSAAANAATAGANATSLAGYRNEDIKLRGRKEDRLAKGTKVTSPAQQAYAVDNALRELASDPRFNKFVVKSDKGTFEATEDDKSLMYSEFKKRLKRLTDASIMKGSPFADEMDDEDPDIEIGAPR